MMRGGREMLIYAVVAGLPLAAVKVFATLSGTVVPKTAEASPIEPVEIPAGVRSEWDEAAQAAGRRAIELRDEPFGPTPLLHRTRVGPDPVDPVTPPDPVLEPVPNLRVQVIWVSPSGNLALINGRKYEVGDRVPNTGWVVTEIDIDARSVRVEHPETDRSQVVSIDER